MRTALKKRSFGPETGKRLGAFFIVLFSVIGFSSGVEAAIVPSTSPPQDITIGTDFTSDDGDNRLSVGALDGTCTTVGVISDGKEPMTTLRVATDQGYFDEDCNIAIIETDSTADQTNCNWNGGTITDLRAAACYVGEIEYQFCGSIGCGMSPPPAPTDSSTTTLQSTNTGLATISIWLIVFGIAWLAVFSIVTL